jgi:16S rRNA (cytosine1402-N4)-methyltransferase
MVTGSPQNPAPDSDAPTPHRRRPRYSGKNPRRFEEKYKEHAAERHPETIAKILVSGKTPAGMHRPIMVSEILEVLGPKPGDIAVDCTLGYGGHAQEILPRLLPGGRLIGLDQDPIELPKTEVRMRAKGFPTEVFTAVRSNFAGLLRVLGEAGIEGADIVLADLGVSSMQLDDPARGFSYKADGPLDLRMNPLRGQAASVALARMSSDALAEHLVGNDEPYAAVLSTTLAGTEFQRTVELANAVRRALPRVPEETRELSVRRVFQALRIIVNDEFGTLETLLRHLPFCLKPGGRAAILTFHSGEDRRVKSAFATGLRQGVYAAVAQEVIRPSPEEQRNNPRSSPAKLRWAIKAA